MRNSIKRSKTIIDLAEKLPVFTLDNFAGIEKDKHYLWLVLHRYEKSGKLLRLKKGIYTASIYVEKMKNRGEIEIFADFLANFLYLPSYLSLETILYRHNILTEIPVNFTSITKNKTLTLTNKLGNFLYHKIKSSLFCGFEIVEESDFSLMKATKAKALFDFLYLRKNILPSKKAVKELRLNIDHLKRADISEFKKYIVLEGSKKMKEILNYLLD